MARANIFTGFRGARYNINLLSSGKTDSNLCDVLTVTNILYMNTYTLTPEPIQKYLGI